MSLLAKPGLLLIKTMIVKQLGYKIAWYDMILNILKNEISFRVPMEGGLLSRVYPYIDTHNVIGMIKTMTQKELKTGDALDLIIIEYRKEGIKIGVYFTDINNIKQSKTINL